MKKNEMNTAATADRFNISGVEELILLSDSSHNLYADHALNWSREDRYTNFPIFYKYFKYELYVDLPIIMFSSGDNALLDRMLVFERMIGKLNIMPAGYMPEVGQKYHFQGITKYDFKIDQKTFTNPYSSFVRFFFVSPDRKDLVKFKKKLNQLNGEILKLDKTEKTLYSFHRRGGRKYVASLLRNYIKTHKKLKTKEKKPKHPKKLSFFSPKKHQQFENDENQMVGEWLLNDELGKTILATARNTRELEKLVRAAHKKNPINPDLAQEGDPDEGIDWVTFGDLSHLFKKTKGKKMPSNNTKVITQFVNVKSDQWSTVRPKSARLEMVYDSFMDDPNEFISELYDYSGSDRVDASKKEIREVLKNMSKKPNKSNKKPATFRKSAKKNSKSKMVHYSQEGRSYFKRVGKGRKTKITKAQFVKAIKQIDSVMGGMTISSDSKTSKQLQKDIVKILKKKITPGRTSSIAKGTLKSRQDKALKVALAVGDHKNLKFKVGKTKVPEKMKKTARNKATKLYVFPIRKSYPIGDLYHARAAMLRSMWPSNSKVRGKVLRAIVTAYPKYDWASYWNKEQKEAKNSRSIKSFAQTIKMK